QRSGGVNRRLCRRAGDRKIEINLVGVVHAHVKHDKENDEQRDRFEDSFEHGGVGLSPSATRHRPRRKRKVAGKFPLCVAAGSRKSRPDASRNPRARTSRSHGAAQTKRADARPRKISRHPRPRNLKLIDITHPHSNALAPWPGDTPFQFKFVARPPAGATRRTGAAPPPPPHAPPPAPPAPL